MFSTSTGLTLPIPTLPAPSSALQNKEHKPDSTPLFAMPTQTNYEGPVPNTMALTKSDGKDYSLFQNQKEKNILITPIPPLATQPPWQVSSRSAFSPVTPKANLPLDNQNLIAENYRSYESLRPSTSLLLPDFPEPATPPTPAQSSTSLLFAAQNEFFSFTSAPFSKGFVSPPLESEPSPLASEPFFLESESTTPEFNLGNRKRKEETGTTNANQKPLKKPKPLPPQPSEYDKTLNMEQKTSIKNIIKPMITYFTKTPFNAENLDQSSTYSAQLNKLRHTLGFPPTIKNGNRSMFGKGLKIGRQRRSDAIKTPQVPLLSISSLNSLNKQITNKCFEYTVGFLLGLSNGK